MVLQSGMGSILYQNDTIDVIVIDIPFSIVEAQQFPANNDKHQLVSCEAIAKPWPNNEPNTEKARTSLGANTTKGVDYTDIINEALAEARCHLNGAYCLPRITQNEPISRKRTLFEIDQGLVDTDAFLYTIQSTKRDGHVQIDLSSKCCNGNSDTFLLVEELAHNLVTNSTPNPVTVHIAPYPDTLSPKFHIPPYSSFCLTSCSPSLSSHSLFHKAPNHAPYQVVILDPPWPNRSIKRSRQSGLEKYAVSRSMYDVRQLLFELDMSSLIDVGAIVGVWITNKPAVRDLVLSDEDGLFSSWNVELIEEWLWVKVTRSGEVLGPVDGLWRKPYEVLLVGRKKSKNNGAAEREDNLKQCIPEVKRRTVLAVPDLHSRKPCLKGLVENIYNLSASYRGLEVFARNLTSGWTSWGNQVLKFNDERCWVKKDITEDQGAV